MTPCDITDINLVFYLKNFARSIHECFCMKIYFVVFSFSCILEQCDHFQQLVLFQYAFLHDIFYPQLNYVISVVVKYLSDI